MKVLFIHQNLTGDTAEAAESKQLIYSLLREGVTVGALYRKYDSPAIHQPDGDYVDLGCTDFTFESIISKIEAFKPDIGHIKSCWTPFHAKAGRVMKKRSIPYILEPGGHLLPILLSTRFAGRPYGFWRKLLKRVYQKTVDIPLVKGASSIRALSPYEANFCKSKFGTNSFVLPLGINEEWRIANPPTRRILDTEVIKFVFIARLDILQKGIDLILHATKKLMDSGYDGKFHVTLAGPPLGDSDVQLNVMIREMDLTNVVKVIPPVHELEKIDLFNSSHVFLHPSRFEEMAKLPREAIATGMPVIASCESNFGDWAETEGFGIATPLSVVGLAHAMEQYIINTSLIESHSKNAIRYSKINTWKDIAQNLTAAYKSQVK